MSLRVGFVALMVCAKSGVFSYRGSGWNKPDGEFDRPNTVDIFEATDRFCNRTGWHVPGYSDRVAASIGDALDLVEQRYKMGRPRPTEYSKSEGILTLGFGGEV